MRRSPIADDDLLDYWTRRSAGGRRRRDRGASVFVRRLQRRLEAMASLARASRRSSAADVCPASSRARCSTGCSATACRSACMRCRPASECHVPRFPATICWSCLCAPTLPARKRSPSPDRSGGYGDRSRARRAGVSHRVEILWATPGESVRRMPSARLRLTLTSDAPDAALLAEYELDHTALPTL